MSDAQANEAEKNVSFFFSSHLGSGRKCAWPWNPAFTWTRVIFIPLRPNFVP